MLHASRPYVTPVIIALCDTLTTHAIRSSPGTLTTTMTLTRPRAIAVATASSAVTVAAVVWGLRARRVIVGRRYLCCPRSHCLHSRRYGHTCDAPPVTAIYHTYLLLHMSHLPLTYIIPDVPYGTPITRHCRRRSYYLHSRIYVNICHTCYPLCTAAAHLAHLSHPSWRLLTLFLTSYRCKKRWRKKTTI
jgi:hypothetical protein